VTEMMEKQRLAVEAQLVELLPFAIYESCESRGSCCFV
jgi:hypothetical protein